LFFYGLGLWSVWYWRGRTLPDETAHYSAIDFGDRDEGMGLDG
jgi:hypothetical protein